MSYPKLTAVMPRDDHTLLLFYANNERRVYDFTPNHTQKFYKQLADIRLFKDVQVIDGEIEWGTGQDFCPHTLYENSTVYNADN